MKSGVLRRIWDPLQKYIWQPIAIERRVYNFVSHKNVGLSLFFFCVCVCIVRRNTDEHKPTVPIALLFWDRISSMVNYLLLLNFYHWNTYPVRTSSHLRTPTLFRRTSSVTDTTYHSGFILNRFTSSFYNVRLPFGTRVLLPVFHLRSQSLTCLRSRSSQDTRFNSTNLKYRIPVTSR